jgi:hypothetical protein
MRVVSARRLALVVLALFVALLFPGEVATAQLVPDGRYAINEVVHRDDNFTVILTSAEVLPGGILQLNTLHENLTAGNSDVRCTRTSNDQSQLTLITIAGQNYYEQDSLCWDNIGTSFPLGQWEAKEFWYRYARVPEVDESFTLSGWTVQPSITLTEPVVFADDPNYVGHRDQAAAYGASNRCSALLATRTNKHGYPYGTLWALQASTCGGVLTAGQAEVSVYDCLITTPFADCVPFAIEG